MNWFEKLNTYFPIGEMKLQSQFESLLSEKGDLYFKDEGEYHIVMYAEFDSFLFIDFLWVSEKSRGKGIGHQLMEKLKAKNKPIILEVEEINPEDSDTERRLHFYNREGFRHASSIAYQFQALTSKSEMRMDILYWSKNEIEDTEIYEAMRKVYEQIHSYKAETFYGYIPKPVNEVVRFQTKKTVQ